MNKSRNNDQRDQTLDDLEARVEKLEGFSGKLVSKDETSKLSTWTPAAPKK